MRFSFVAPVAWMLVAACSDSAANRGPLELSIVAPNDYVAIGDSMQLTVKLTDADGRPVPTGPSLVDAERDVRHGDHPGRGWETRRTAES